MTAMLKAAAAGLVLVLAACATRGEPSAYAPPAPEAQAVRVQSLLDADRAFAARAQTAGAAAAFADFMAEDGKLLGAAAEPVIGTAAIFEVMVALPENAEISWAPVEAVVAESGELGFTWGDYRLSAPGADGSTVVETGRYLTVWRKDAQGRWRGVIDIGT